MKKQLHRCLFVGLNHVFSLLCLSFFISCSSGLAHAKNTQPTSTCPAGSFDYGSGMVAASLPDSVIEALNQARAQVVAQAAGRLSPFLATQRWNPHISLIYGIKANDAAPAYQALQNFSSKEEEIRACFGRLRYWDDADGNKTTVVVDIEEPAGKLGALHTHLAQATQISSRFAYHAHITLAFLQAGTRFDTNEEASIFASLKNRCWQENDFYITDHCGQRVYNVHLNSSVSDMEEPSG